MLNDDDLYSSPSDFDFAGSNSTATTAGMMPKPVIAPPPVQLDLGASPATALGLTSSPPPLSASPAPQPLPGSNTIPMPTPQPQNVPRGNSQELSTPDAPAPSIADILAGAQKAGQGAMGAYTPENRQELYRMMLAKQNSTQSGVGQALAGLGDALVRGPGRGESHALDSTIKQGQDATATALGNFDDMQKGKSNELQTGLSLEQMDPNSAASKSAQTAARPMLVAAGLTDKQIATLPANAIDGALKSATGFADAKAKLAQVAAMREQTHELSRQRNDAATGMKFEQELNASKQRSGALGDNQKRLNASERVLALIDQSKGNPNAMQTPELAQAVASLIGGGGGVVSQQQVEHLMPQSFKGDMKKFLGWLTNDPVGLDQQKFVQSYADTANRERTVIKQQLGLAQAKSASGYMDYIRSNAADARAKLEAQDLPAPVIDQIMKGNFTNLDKAFQPTGGGAAGGAPDHAGAAKWLQLHPDDPSAPMVRQRLQMATGGMNGI